MPSAWPTPKVEISFTTDPAASPVWVDVSGRVMELHTRRGRQVETDRFSAGTATVQFYDRDRSLDPTNAAGPWFGGLLPGRRIRISAIWNSVTYPVFAGSIGAWPPAYQTFGLTVVGVQATDLFKVLANTELRLGNVPEELSGARVGRVLDAVGVPVADRTITAGASLLLAQADLTTKALEYLQNIESTENGRFWIGQDGKVRFLGRWDMGQAPYTVSQATYGDAGTELRYKSLQPTFDDVLVANDIRLTGIEADAVEQAAEDQTSILRHYRRTWAQSGLLASDNELRESAAYRLGIYKDPALRFSSMVVDGVHPNVNMWPTTLGREISDRLTIRRRPPGGGAVIEQPSILEGINWDWVRGSWLATFLLSPFGTNYTPYPATKTFFVLGTSQLTTGNGVIVY